MYFIFSTKTHKNYRTDLRVKAKRKPCSFSFSPFFFSKTWKWLYNEQVTNSFLNIYFIKSKQQETKTPKEDATKNVVETLKSMYLSVYVVEGFQRARQTFLWKNEST